MQPARPHPLLRLFFWLLLVAWLTGSAPLRAGEAYKWTVQYLIDNSRTIFGKPQKVSPRNSRGLAISPDGKYLYVGYDHGYNNNGQVRRISLDSNDFDRASVNVIEGPMGKAIATDDKGRVYISDENAIVVYDAPLHTRELEINAGECEGIAVTREGHTLVVYGTDRGLGTLSRWEIREKGDDVVEATAKGFGDGSGTIHVEGAVDLRGLRVDDKGNIWIADLKSNKVIKLSHDGKVIGSANVKTPIDLAFDGNRIFVTRWRDRAISVLDENMNLIGNLGVPWEELELAPFGNNRIGALSGIVTIPGKCFFVANEAGQTADQKSTYGRTDDRSDVVGGKFYKDVFDDDNDPILKATLVSTPDPATPRPQ